MIRSAVFKAASHVQGMVFELWSRTRRYSTEILDALTHPTPRYHQKVSGPKVAIFTSVLDIAQTETREASSSKTQMTYSISLAGRGTTAQKEIADSGTKVIIAGSFIDELALHYLGRFDIAVLKLLSKSDLHRTARIVNATPLARIGAPTLEEASYVDIFETTEIGDRFTVSVS
ncbi:hypothetical protein EDB19DRAFT_1919921 [Suillus lakei]|nr:hypothetical protein EDB19DRAFT_1919921 [Suillus lakei]